MPVTPPDTPFQMQSWIDGRQLAAAFRSSGRLHIPQFLVPTGAQRLYEYLAKDASWSLVVHDGKDVREALPAVRKQFPQLDAELASVAYTSAPERFQFLYECERAPDAPAERAANPTPLNRFLDFINSRAFIEFIRQLSGIDSITWADGQATRYRPGDFLTIHNDFQADKKRRLAYVLNLTPVWKPDWGGLLQFINAEGNVAEAYAPRFNALNVFTVPQLHSVSIVTPFAQALRYSITGWLRE